MKKIKILLMLIALAFSGFSQDFEIPTTKPIKLVQEDTITQAYVSFLSLAEKKIDEQKRYFWFSKDKIESNLGGYYGKLLDGSFETMVSNKLTVSGTFEKGLKQGVWNKWYNNGNYLEISKWKNGMRHGMLKEFFRSGQLKQKLKYKNGKRNGEYRIFDEEGLLIEKGSYKLNKKHGRVVKLASDGSYEHLKFRKGELVPEKIKKPKLEKEKSENSKVLKKETRKNKKGAMEEGEKEKSKLGQWWKNIFKKKEANDENSST